MERTTTPSDSHAGNDSEYDVWFCREVRIGLDQANAGLLISSDEVEAEAAIWRAQIQQKIEENQGDRAMLSPLPLVGEGARRAGEGAPA